MDYKKKYKEAFERAKYIKENTDSVGAKDASGIIEYIFSELKETEDEKIRKEILEYFQQFENDELRGVNISDWIAWLEKQGEKKDIHLMELKAKAYDDAKERISYAYNQNRVPIGFISEIFPNLSLYENQGESKFEQCIQDGDKIVTNEDGTHFNVSQLERVAKKEPKSAWSEEDEKALCDALWAMKIAAKIAKDENDMGNIWYAENWLKSLKERMKGE